MSASPNGGSGAADKLYAAKRRLGDFDFGKETAAVFDDMLGRSVPFYDEIQRMVGELVGDFAVDGTSVYDLGCSTGNTILSIGSHLTPDLDLRFIGIDNSPEMLEKARKKLTDSGLPWPWHLELRDLNEPIGLSGASVVLMVLTLQFVRPLNREVLLGSIFESLNRNGCLILVEKVLGEKSTFNRLFIDHYYAFKKRMGYSDIEIAQKREALENVLIPYRLEENKEMLNRLGFSQVEVFFKWYNFCGIIALK